MQMVQKATAHSKRLKRSGPRARHAHAKQKQRISPEFQICPDIFVGILPNHPDYSCSISGSIFFWFRPAGTAACFARDRPVFSWLLIPSTPPCGPVSGSPTATGNGDGEEFHPLAAYEMMCS